MHAGGAAIDVPVREVKGYGADANRCTPSERNGQQHWLSLVKNKKCRFQFSHQVGF